MNIPMVANYSTNPISGTFGTGNVKFFSSSGTWTVPAGIGKVRARIWGGGAYGGGGGGFSLITVYNLYGVTSIPITVGSGGASSSSSTGGTSSFGSYASATGGLSGSGGGGTGINGDINSTGGGVAGGGVASIYGNGGATTTALNQGGAGSGGNSTGMAGFLMTGTVSSTYTTPVVPFTNTFNLDWIGTGCGGSSVMPAVNGGGGGVTYTSGSFPGGGGYSGGLGANGLVIVEW